jgi:hypothetical protein
VWPPAAGSATRGPAHRARWGVLHPLACDGIAKPGHPGDLPARRGRPLPCQGGRSVTGGVVLCRRTRSDVAVHAVVSQDVTGAGGPFAPGLLRQTSAGARAASRRPGAARPRGGLGAAPRRDRRPTSRGSAPKPPCGSPPGGRWDAAPCHPSSPSRVC